MSFPGGKANMPDTGSTLTIDWEGEVPANRRDALEQAVRDFLATADPGVRHVLVRVDDAIRGATPHRWRFEPLAWE
jgi:hypothetical protein